ncbi:hypothetical protein AOLI_G00220800 [Acnodon oligacanthus]
MHTKEAVENLQASKHKKCCDITGSLLWLLFEYFQLIQQLELHQVNNSTLVGAFDDTMVTIPVFLLLFSVFSPAVQSRFRTFHIIPKSLTHSEAQAACRTKYTDLVTVYSDEDNAALINFINDPSVAAWIGLTRNQSSDKWSNRDDVTFTNLTGVCGSGSCCAAMKADGSWESLQCTQQRNFMCYKQDTDRTLKYYLISKNMSWYEAQSYCRKSYTDLVSIRDQNQNKAVKTAGMKNSTSFWIGLLRDDWEWTDGGRSAYRNWEMYQPWSSGDCVRVRAGKWAAKPCSYINSALCYSTLIHVSDECMSWENALDYCKKDNRNDILRIESDLDQKEVEFELRRRRVSGPLWVGLGQSRLSELLKSSKVALGPRTNWNERQTKPPQSLSCPVLRTSKTKTVTPELRQIPATATAEISTPTTETHIVKVVSGEIPVKTKKASKISVAANNDVPTATDTVNEISVAANSKVAEISVAAEELHMAADNIVSESETAFRFSLISVLNHLGHSIDFGHYVSDCSSQSDSHWLSSEDGKVTLATEEQVAQRRRRSAYSLLYERKCLLCVTHVLLSFLSSTAPVATLSLQALESRPTLPALNFKRTPRRPEVDWLPL